jgi:HPt (histidine-containing phosphotransfer) domain-containing protein
MRTNSASIALLIMAGLFCACQSSGQREAERRREEQDRNSAAFKAGEAAHKIANEAEKLGADAGRKLDESAHKAREGWKAEKRKDPPVNKRNRTDASNR